MNTAAITTHAAGFNALGHPMRLAMLRLVLESTSGLRLNQLARACQTSQPNASQHVAKLLASGVFLVEKDGPFSVFTVDKARVRQLRAFI